MTYSALSEEPISNLGSFGSYGSFTHKNEKK